MAKLTATYDENVTEPGTYEYENRVQILKGSDPLAKRQAEQAAQREAERRELAQLITFENYDKFNIQDGTKGGRSGASVTSLDYGR